MRSRAQPTVSTFPIGNLLCFSQFAKVFPREGFWLHAGLIVHNYCDPLYYCVYTLPGTSVSSRDFYRHVLVFTPFAASVLGLFTLVAYLVLERFQKKERLETQTRALTSTLTVCRVAIHMCGCTPRPTCMHNMHTHTHTHTHARTHTYTTDTTRC